MPDVSSRIRASIFPVVFVTMAVMVGTNEWVASSERTLAGRMVIAEAEARKAQSDLEAEKARNVERHASSLEDREKTKKELKVASDLAFLIAKRFNKLEAEVAVLRTNLGVSR